MFTILGIYILLKTKGMVELDKDVSKVLVAPIVIGFLLCIGLDISIIKFIICH